MMIGNPFSQQERMGFPLFGKGEEKNKQNPLQGTPKENAKQTQIETAQTEKGNDIPSQ